MPKKCPKCGSENTEIEGNEELGFLICPECGYHEADEYETPGDRKSKGGKSSPYKKGGSLRTQKR